MIQFDSCGQLLDMLVESVGIGMLMDGKAILNEDIIEISGYQPTFNVGTEILLDIQHPEYIFCITEDLGDGNFQLTLDRYRMVVDQNPGVILPMKYRQTIIDLLRWGNYY